MQYFYASFLENGVSFWGLCPQTLTGELPLDPMEDFRPSDPLSAHEYNHF